MAKDETTYRIRECGTITHQDDFREYDWETVMFSSATIPDWLAEYVNEEEATHSFNAVQEYRITASGHVLHSSEFKTIDWMKSKDYKYTFVPAWLANHINLNMESSNG